MTGRLRILWKRFIQGNPAAAPEWRASPGAFERWALANGYADAKLLLRYHKERGYTPGNCYWAEKTNRGQGRRNKHFITLGGETHSAAEWARITGIPYQTIMGRIAVGRTPEEILRK